MISLTDSVPQQLQKVQYSTRTTQNSQLPLSLVPTMDRIGEDARIVHEYVCGDKLFLVSLTESLLQRLQQVPVLPLHHAELTITTFSDPNSG